MQDYEPHPAAALFPILGEQELQKLADDIRAHGLLEPIVLYEGKVLDGRNRLEACKRAGVEPKFVMLVPYKEGQPIDGGIRIKIYQEHPDLGIEPKFVEGGLASPILYVLSKNLHRRHLTPSQRAAIAAEAVPMLKEEARQRQLAGLRKGDQAPVDTKRYQRGELSEINGIREGKGFKKTHHGRALQVAAEEAGVGYGTVQRALEVRRANPEEHERIKRGEITVGEAHSKLPPRPKKRHGTRVHKEAPYAPETKRQVELAEGEKRKMVNILSHTAGACRGLPELDVPMILSVCTAEEVKEWCKTSLLAAGQLRTFVSNLRRRISENGKEAE